MSQRSFYTDRKGVELTLQTVAIAILVLIIIVVLAMIFGSFMQRSITEYLGLANSSSSEIRGEKCASIIMGRSCVPNAAECAKDGFGILVPGTWSDCPQGKICCERQPGTTKGQALGG